MPPSRPVVYWDSSIFLAWLKNENRPAGEMDGVRESVKRIEAGQDVMVTSAVMMTEVYQSRLDDRQKKMFADLFKRRSVGLIEMDHRIATLAGEIREYYQNLSASDGRPSLTEFDVIHLATAVHYRVSAFYTFDSGDRGGRGLLKLGGVVAGYPLNISKPPWTQRSLFQ